MEGSQGMLDVEAPEGTIDPRMGARAFAETPLGKECGKKLEGMRTHFYLERAQLSGRAYRVEIIYEGEALSHVDLFLHMWGDAEGWAGWSEQRERSRKEQAEEWAKKAFGKAMEVKPFELEGETVVPFEVKWDTARRLKFEWGEVVSYFDSKGGFSGMGVHYERAQL
jgi:hypothetical protein